MAAIREKNPSEATKQEYRKVLERFPGIVSQYGDISLLYRRQAAARFDNHPMMQEAVKVQFNTMRDELAGENATPTELLLVDAVLGCWFDYWTFAMLHEQRTGSPEGSTLKAFYQWEQTLASKESRYLRAVETLARVRRLLKLTIQINVATPGSQQVNVAGDVQIAPGGQG
jgi:hypothetical protein